MSVKITAFEAENVKRIKAVKVEPTPSGLTIIGGKNNQGKTSVLDAIAWALGGDRKRPDNAKREGSVLPPELNVVLSNGVRVTRSGANGALKVIDPEGNKAGQTLLNSFIEELALDLPKFMAMTDKEKADALLRIIGVGDELYTLENQEKLKYNERRSIGQIADQKQGAADEMPHYSDVPSEPIGASELIQQQQTILAKNGENQRKRENLDGLQHIKVSIQKEVERLEAELAKQNSELAKVNSDISIAMKTVAQLEDESTAEIEESLAEIDEINEKVRINERKKMAQVEAEQYREQYVALSEEIDELRTKKMALLDGAKLPLEGLSVEGAKLVYNGYSWGDMSGSDQLKVATAIVRALNPDCGFVLVDKLEQMDLDTLAQFGAWAEAEGLQIIATKVSTGDECQIIIEDGVDVKAHAETEPETVKPLKKIGGGF